MRIKATVILLTCIFLAACSNVHRVNDAGFRGLIYQCGIPGIVREYHYDGCKNGEHIIKLREMNFILPGESVEFYTIKDVDLSSESKAVLSKLLNDRSSLKMMRKDDVEMHEAPLDWKWL